MKLFFFAIGALLVSVNIIAQTTLALCDSSYKEGFGKDATGGAGKPTYIVTSPADTGVGSFAWAVYSPWTGQNLIQNVNIVFAVDTFTIPGAMYIGSNVTIDGMANGMNGAILDATATAKRNLIIEDPHSNIIIRGINFRSTGTPNSGATEFDLLSLDGTNGQSISNVFIDRCTFMQASDGALDITGNVSNVTVQRSLFYGNAITSLIKYGTRKNISIHHNIYVHNGERNPQVKGDMRLLDYVNNVIYNNNGDVTNYPDGTPTSPYGIRIWNANNASDSPGNVTINVTNCAHIGTGGRIDLITDAGASAANVYIGSSYCSPISN